MLEQDGVFKMKQWKVTRTTIITTIVEAETREQAIQKANDNGFAMYGDCVKDADTASIIKSK